MAEDTQYTSDTATDSANGDAVRRADDLFDQAGQRLGSFAAQARLRLQAPRAIRPQGAHGRALARTLARRPKRCNGPRRWWIRRASV